jgi:hypothetical protein
LLLIALFLWQTGCSTYTQIQPGEVSDFDHVRVRLADGDRRDLYHPYLEADTIRFNAAQGPRSPNVTPTLFSIPLDRVTEIQGIESDTGKTTGLVVLIVVGAAAVGFAAFALACSPPCKCGGVCIR